MLLAYAPRRQFKMSRDRDGWTRRPDVHHLTGGGSERLLQDYEITKDNVAATAAGDVGTAEFRMGEHFENTVEVLLSASNNEASGIQ